MTGSCSGTEFSCHDIARDARDMVNSMSLVTRATYVKFLYKNPDEAFQARMQQLTCTRTQMKPLRREARAALSCVSGKRHH